MLFSRSPRCCLLWRSRAAWRAWRSWLSSRHSSSVSVHSGAPDGSTQMFSVSAENPPHTPVMLKEVLHYLDIQPGQVCSRVCCSVKEGYCFWMKYSLKKCQGLWSLHRLSKSSCFGFNPWEVLGAPFEHFHQPCLHTSPWSLSAPRFKTIFNSTRRSPSQLCVPQCCLQRCISIQHTYKIQIDSLWLAVSCVFSTKLLLTQAINKHSENWTAFRLSASLICCRKQWREFITCTYGHVIL